MRVEGGCVTSGLATNMCQHEGSDTLEISYASSEITFEIMKSHTQKKSEITLFENENRKTPYISVNYGREHNRSDLRPESLDLALVRLPISRILQPKLSPLMVKSFHHWSHRF